MDHERPSTAAWPRILAAALFAVIVWTSWGHHRYDLAGDEALNFQMHVRLENAYFQANAEAWAEKLDGDEEEPVDHLALIEGGFPVVLFAARQIDERLPFMVNALVLPFLLLAFAGCLAVAETDRRRRWLGALFALWLVLAFPRASDLIWRMALPFRDTGSHALGFGSLLVLLAVSRRPQRAAWGAFCAGAMIGLGGWTRLSGFLFAIPAAVLLASFPEFGGFRRRLGLIAALGAGTSIGLGLVVAQNLFEGRSPFMAPQADKLLMRPQTIQVGEAIRKGWHPANLPLVLPKYVASVRHTYPDGWHVLFLAGTLGWLATAGRLVRRWLPLAAGFAVYLLFYGCYDKVVFRYLVIILLFHGILAGIAVGWAMDALLKGVGRLGARTAGWAAAILGAALGVAAATAALRSGPDVALAQGEWRDARRFRDWLRAEVPEAGFVRTPDQGFENWILYFGESRRTWWARVLDGKRIDPSRATLPEGPVFLLVPFRDDPENYGKGWVRDALLNRFDLEAHGKPLLFRHSRFDGVRLFAAKERAARERALEVAPSAAPSRALYLYLRELSPGTESQEVVLSHDSWPGEWKVRVRAGVNLLALPDGFQALPTRLVLSGEDPLPSVLEAAWMGPEGIGVGLGEYEHVYSRLLTVSGAELIWGGYPKWWRDWGEHSGYHASTPRVSMGPGSRIRLPRISGMAEGRLEMRMFYSLASTDRECLRQVSGLEYRRGPDRISPQTAIRGRRYPFKDADAIDFIQDLEIDLSRIDPDRAESLELAFPADPSSEKPGLWFLHRVEYRLATAGESRPPPPPGRSTRWLVHGFGEGRARLRQAH